MRKVALDLAVTLDGFIEGPDGETDWCVMEEDMDFEGFLSTIDTIFYGRISYDIWGSYLPGKNAGAAESRLWESVRSKEKYVFSSRDRQDGNATFITSGIPEKVAEIKSRKGKDIWLYGGASLIRTFIHSNLVDTYRISVHPVVLGSGKPLFGHLKDRLNLKLIQANTFNSGVVQLIYKPDK